MSNFTSEKPGVAPAPKKRTRRNVARGRSLRGGAYRKEIANDNENPAEGVTNLADAMLVFAAGLMLALITFYDVDIINTAKVQPDTDAQVLEDVERNIENTQRGGEGYDEMGVVYRDPVTGEMYLKLENQEEVVRPSAD